MFKMGQLHDSFSSMEQKSYCQQQGTIRIMYLQRNLVLNKIEFARKPLYTEIAAPVSFVHGCCLL